MAAVSKQLATPTTALSIVFLDMMFVSLLLHLFMAFSYLLALFALSLKLRVLESWRYSRARNGSDSV